MKVCPCLTHCSLFPLMSASSFTTGPGTGGTAVWIDGHRLSEPCMRVRARAPRCPFWHPTSPILVPPVTLPPPPTGGLAVSCPPPSSLAIPGRRPWPPPPLSHPPISPPSCSPPHSPSTPLPPPLAPPLPPPGEGAPFPSAPVCPSPAPSLSAPLFPPRSSFFHDGVGQTSPAPVHEHGHTHDRRPLDTRRVSTGEQRAGCFQLWIRPGPA